MANPSLLTELLEPVYHKTISHRGGLYYVVAPISTICGSRLRSSIYSRNRLGRNQRQVLLEPNKAKKTGPATALGIKPDDST